MSQLFYHVMQDNLGNLLFGVSGTMRLAGTGTLATIYGDEFLTIPIPNPMTNHPSFGSFKCFLGAGDYDFYMAKAGYTFETLTGVQGGGGMANQEANNVAITGGHIQVTSLQVDSPTLVVDHVTRRVGIGVGARPRPSMSGARVLAPGGGHWYHTWHWDEYPEYVGRQHCLYKARWGLGRHPTPPMPCMSMGPIS